MERKDILSGILQAKGYLATESGKILLTERHEETDQRPELIPLEIPPEDIGKMAFVAGNLKKRCSMAQRLSRLSHR